MAGTVQGTSSSDINAINQQKIKDFQDGKINISKGELKNLVTSAIAQGETPSNTVVDILDSYDKIDTNGDGINYKEFQTYAKTPAAMLSSLGINTKNMQQQFSLLDTDFLSSSQSSDSGNMFTPLTGSYNANARTGKTPSLIDFLS